MGRVSKNFNNSRGARTVFSSILIAVVLAVALMPLASAQADTASSASPPAPDTPTDTSPKADDPAPPEATPPSDDPAPPEATPASDSPAPPDAPASDANANTPATSDAPADNTAPVVDPPAPPAPADDGDGVDAAIENAAPHAGDNNQDGIADAEQRNVASLPAAVDVDKNGALDDYVTIVSPDGTTLHGVSALEVPTDSAPPGGAIFHYGLFDYEVQVANAGDTADVSIVLPAGPATTSVFMFQDGAWTEVTQHADIDNDQNEVTVALADGGVGDADHAADGVIDDPVGVAGQPNTVTVEVETPAASSPDFTFRLELCDNSDSSGSVAACDSTDPDVFETPDNQTLSKDEQFTWGSLLTGRVYRLTVTSPLPAGWQLDSRGCNPNGGNATNDGSFGVRMYLLSSPAADTNAFCTFTFSQITGDITITKDVAGGTSPKDFSFTATGVTPASFSLDDDADATLPNSITFQDVPQAQTYTFTELVPAGWSLGTVSCSNTSSESQISNGVSLTLDTSSTTCTFTNTPPANTGSITIVKDVSGGTNAQDFHFTTTGGLSPSSFDLDDDADGTLPNLVSYANIPTGTYTFTESATPGWLLGGTIVCSGSTSETQITRGVSVPLTNGQNVVCTFVNSPNVGTITIVKDVSGGTDAQDFHFSTTGGLTPSSFDLDDDGNNGNTLSNQIVFSNVPADTVYTITEDSLPGWVLSSVSCPNFSETQIAGGVSLDINNGNNVTCTFTNLKNTATLTIVKDVAGGTDAQNFHFATTGGLSPSSFDLDDDADGTLLNTIVFSNVPAGTYTVTEDAVASWALTGISCPSFSEIQIAGGVSLNLVAGNNVTCTFTNTKFSGTITVHKGGNRANPAGTDTPVNYAAGLENAVFEYRLSGSADPWVTLCTTNPSGDCTSGVLPPGDYDVREKSAPAGWSTISELTYGGDSSGGGNQTHEYVGTVTVGTSGTSEPELQYTNDSDDTENHRFINVKDDKPLPAEQCGIDIAMILDVSGSIGRAPSSAQIYEDAATSFITALDGTPTTLTRIVKFSDSATVVNPGNFPISLQTDANDAITEIDGVYSSVGGGTNWDAALKAMNGSGADVVVMITDGNPTTWDGSPNGGGGDITLNDLAAGIASANSLKAESTILAVGVGTAPAVTAANLATISGPGFFYTASLDQIQQQLEDLANQLCGSRIHVQKWVGGQLTNGWMFAGAATGANVTYPKGQVTGGGANPPLPTGEMQINLDNVPVDGATDVTVTETLEADYAILGRKCQQGSFPTPQDADADNGGISINIGTVQRNQDWYCTFVNELNPGSITVEKRTIGGTGSFDFTLTGQSNRTVQTVTPGVFLAGTPWSNLTPGNFTIDESDPGASWVEGTFSCNYAGSQDPAVTGASPQIPLAAGQAWTCQITNTKKGSVTVEKRTIGGTGSFDFTLTGQSNRTVQTVTPGVFLAGTPWSNLTPGQFTIDETNPDASWIEGPFTCKVGDSTIASGDGPLQFTLAAGADVVCQITNTKKGTVTVEKRTIGGTGSFDFTLTGQSNRTVQTVTPGVFLAGTPWSNLTPGNFTIDESDPGASWVEGTFSCNYEGSQDPPVTGASPQITLAAGQAWTCQITNTKKGSVLVEKQTVGAVGSFDFTLTGQSGKSVTTTQQNTFTQPVSGAWSNLTPGNFTIDETNPDASWIEGPFTCKVGDSTIASGDGPLQFTLAAGADVVCQITNTKKGTVTVEKRTIGGTGSFDFTLTGQSNRTVQTVTPGVFLAGTPWSNLTPGNFTIDESDPGASWVEGTFSCNYAGSQDPPVTGASPQITLAAGQAWTCQITNTKKGSVLVEKQTVGAVGSFDFTLTGQSGKSVTTTQQNTFTQPVSGVWSNLTPGNFTIDETNPDASWIEGPFTCKVGDSTIASGDGPLQFTLAAGADVVCQITNTKKGTVTVEKRTIGGTGSFDFTLTGQSNRTVQTVTPGVFLAGTPWSNLTPGQFTIDETNPDASWIEGPFTCKVGETTIASGDGPLQFTLAAGADVVCQNTNTKKGSILVRKQTVGAVGSFDFTLTGQSGKSVTTTQQNTFTQPPSGAWTNLTPGNFTIDETDPGASWVEGSFTCTLDGTPTQVMGVSPSIPVGAGESWTCQITNTKKGSVLVEKQTVGGVGSFDFTLTGQSGKSVTTAQQNQFTPPASGAWSNLTPGNFTIDESDPDASWIEGSFTCKAGEATVASGDGPLQFTLDPGADVVCRITNTKKGTITVVKTTVGDVGSFDFTLTGQPNRTVQTVTPGTPVPGTPWSNLTPGNFTIDESDPGASWVEGTFSCNYEGSQDPPVTGASPQIPLAAGQAWTCQITNTKKGSVLVEKQTVGAVGSFDFTLTGQSGKSVTTSQQNTFTQPASGAWSNLTPGNFTIDESDPGASWVEGTFSCNYEGSQDPPVTGASPQIPLAAGQAWTCQITNTKKGSILVEKRTLGATGVFDFTLTGQSGKSVTTSQQNTFTPPVSGAWSNLTPGQFTIDEIDPDASWIEGPFTCKVGETTIASGDGPLQFTLDPGADVLCQITNTKKGSVTVEKRTLGATGVFDFTLTGQSGKSVTTAQQNTFTPPVSGAWSNLTPGQFTIDEIDPDASWIEGPFTCKVGDSTIASGDGPLQFTLAAGADVVCQITNTKKGTVTVEKRTIGGTGSFDFTLTGQSNRTVQTVTPGVFLAGTPWSNLTPGNFTIDESDPGASWVEGTFSCNYEGSQDPPVTGASPQITLAAGQAWTCQITNTKKGSVLVEKQTVGAVGSFDFTLTGQSGKSVTTTQQNTFTQAPSGAWTNLTPGNFTIDETNPDASWIEGPFTCKVGDSTIASGDGPLQFTLAAGADVVCQITNTKKGSITIVKDAVPQDAQNFTFNTTNLGGQFTLDDDGDDTLSNTKEFPNLSPGTTYTVTEIPVSGWKLVTLQCTGLGQGDSSSSSTGTVSVEMKPGQVVECTYTNQSPDLGVVKSDDPDPVVAGTQLTYTVVVTNHGPADATGVVVTDTLDPNTTFVSTSLGADCSHAAGVVTCDLGDLASGDFVEFTITVLVSPGAPVGEDTLNNVVDVEGDQPDWNPENNHDEEPTSVISDLDLAITKTDGGARPAAGEGSFTYTLAVDNLGPSDAQDDATVIDLLSAEVTFVSFGTLPAGVTCDPPVGRTITCGLDKDLLDVADDPVTIAIEVSVKAGTPSGDVTNQTIVTSPDDEAPCTVTPENITCDPSDTNNYDEAVTPVTAIGGINIATADPPAALALTGSSSQTIALLGGLLLGAGAIFLVASRRRRKKVALGS